MSADRRARDERREAFAGVVAHYEAALLRYASHILNDNDAAQDVVQDAFIRLLHRWRETFEPGPRISSWLYRVTHNCAVDQLRRRARQHTLHQKATREQPETAPPDRGAAFRISDAAARAAAALQTLSVRERQLVVLKVYEEKSYKEIAAIAGLTPGNVGYILHHAMKKLAVHLSQHEGDQP